ncbi:nucleotidyltransferase [Solirubrobacter sp. CPCC 204708]|uniref:CBASS oligonucleotide cyclase n=1 Tax=Solirubrobacter deserti TaxID=2282478 RepID=A0ABT4REW5_9ACTN|nr:CBASS oligonucleotide cyclase [Solirubrobacter deserti]MBE2318600.1 nucleotidyltransferase [Solirubrobacter deserti]MDA0137058.1 CBASS oligonucleotide cyclase [Solirubrobacter deserti]
MGGSGGGGLHSSRSADELRAEVQKELEQARLESDVNALLNEQLALINNRDTELVNERLDEITNALGDRIAGIDRLLYGGSVAKHTYVDGLSDVDSLVVLKHEALDGDTPSALRSAMERALRQGLDMGRVASIDAGFAVTVTYKDGNQIQLLPAVERGGNIAISDKAGTGWSFIRPRAFEERLTHTNREQGGRVVPTIKLAKAVVDASLGERDRPGGYHMEALAVDAFRGYQGPRNAKAMLGHFFSHAAERIKRPIADVTGQSTRIDETFGAENSPHRQRVATALRRIASRMQNARSAEEWRRLLE